MSGGEADMLTALGAWLAMDGYGAFVWAAYGLGLGALAGLVALSWRRHRAVRRALAALESEAGQ